MMKPLFRILLSFILFFLVPFSWVNGQEEKVNYGNIPDELVAYDKYQKAYKYHFLEPTLFYGAGREKLPPADSEGSKDRISWTVGRINYCTFG